jgi:hypothetical protein
VFPLVVAGTWGKAHWERLAAEQKKDKASQQQQQQQQQ